MEEERLLHVQIRESRGVVVFVKIRSSMLDTRIRYHESDTRFLMFQYKLPSSPPGGF